MGMQVKIMGKKIENQKETIRIGDWTIRPRSQNDRWKVSGGLGNFTLNRIEETK